jgi:hypothetical protein
VGVGLEWETLAPGSCEMGRAKRGEDPEWRWARASSCLYDPWECAGEPGLVRCLWEFGFEAVVRVDTRRLEVLSVGLPAQRPVKVRLLALDARRVDPRTGRFRRSEVGYVWGTGDALYGWTWTFPAGSGRMGVGGQWGAWGGPISPVCIWWRLGSPREYFAVWVAPPYEVEDHCSGAYPWPCC